jgi:hypothetical protein
MLCPFHEHDAEVGVVQVEEVVCHALHVGVVAPVAHKDVRVCMTVPVCPVGHASVCVCAGCGVHVEVGAGAVLVEDVLDVVEVVCVTGEGVVADADDDCPATGVEALAPLCGAAVVTVVFGAFVARDASAVVACEIAVCATCTALSRVACGNDGLALTMPRSMSAVCKRVTMEVKDMVVMDLVLR